MKKVFFAALVSSIILAVVAAQDEDPVIMTAFNIGIMIYAYAQLSIGQLVCTGHGVGGVRKVFGVSHILGMPWVMWIMIMIISGLCAALIGLGMQDVGGLGPNFRIIGFGLGGFLGVGISVFDWHNRVSAMTWYHSTYKVILDLKHLGLDEAAIKKEIDSLRRKGLLAPTDK